MSKGSLLSRLSPFFFVMCMMVAAHGASFPKGYVDPLDQTLSAQEAQAQAKAWVQTGAARAFCSRSGSSCNDRGRNAFISENIVAFNVLTLASQREVWLEIQDANCLSMGFCFYRSLQKEYEEACKRRHIEPYEHNRQL